jgi:hypothetical protein
MVEGSWHTLPGALLFLSEDIYKYQSEEIYPKNSISMLKHRIGYS